MVDNKLPHEAALDKLKMIAGEHFDGYLLVVSKDSRVWTTYKNKTSALGMAVMVAEEIKEDWRKQNDSE